MNQRIYDDVSSTSTPKPLRDKREAFLLLSKMNGKLILPYEEIQVELNTPFPKNAISMPKGYGGGFFELLNQGLSGTTRVVGGYQCFIDLELAKRIAQADHLSIFRGFIPAGAMYTFSVGYFISETALINEEV